jgi:hypothetical protein
MGAATNAANQALQASYGANPWNENNPMLQAMFNGPHVQAQQVSTQGAYTPYQTEAHGNDAASQFMQAAATQNRMAQNQAGAQGFGAASPALAATQQANTQRGYAGGINERQNIDWNAALANRQINAQTSEANQAADLQAQEANRNWLLQYGNLFGNLYNQYAAANIGSRAPLIQELLGAGQPQIAQRQQSSGGQMSLPVNWNDMSNAEYV